MPDPAPRMEQHQAQIGEQHYKEGSRHAGQQQPFPVEFQRKIFGIFNESIKLGKTTMTDSQELN